MSTLKKWKLVKGKKHPKDEILLYYNKPVSFEDLAVMCRFFMINEDRIYPPPRFKGAEMFKEYIKEVLDTRDMPNKNKFKLNKG
tara:strand:+ start:163 stop:414 length:252 start_codon:yes stop_codon:yes gene_type:complete